MGMQAARMDDDDASALARRLEAHAHDGRSKLYQYLWRQHRALSKAMVRLNPSWASIAAEIAAAGIMGANGRPASPTAVRNVWWRVCRDVEARKRARQAERDKRGMQPSRLPATWKPTPVLVPRAADPARYAPPVPTAPRTAPTELSEEAKATLADLDRQFAHRDRFVNPPKRKD